MTKAVIMQTMFRKVQKQYLLHGYLYLRDMKCFGAFVYLFWDLFEVLLRFF